MFKAGVAKIFITDVSKGATVLLPHMSIHVFASMSSTLLLGHWLKAKRGDSQHDASWRQRLRVYFTNHWIKNANLKNSLQWYLGLNSEAWIFGTVILDVNTRAEGLPQQCSLLWISSSVWEQAGAGLEAYRSSSPPGNTPLCVLSRDMSPFLEMCALSVFSLHFGGDRLFVLWQGLTGRQLLHN